MAFTIAAGGSPLEIPKRMSRSYFIVLMKRFNVNFYQLLLQCNLLRGNQKEIHDLLVCVIK